MAVTVASNPKSPPGDPVRDAREVSIQDGIGNMVTPAYIKDSPKKSKNVTQIWESYQSKGSNLGPCR